MAVIKRANVAPPVLPKETVEVEALGGEVVVQGLLLSDRQDLEAYMVALARAGREAVEGGAGAQAPGMAKVMPRLLHLSVLDADGERIYTEQEWQIFGGAHHGQAMALFLVAWRLSGFKQADNAKN